MDRYTLTVGITDDQKPDADRALRDWPTPMAAMDYMVRDSVLQQGYKWAWAECWRWEDGTKRERQWRIDID